MMKLKKSIEFSMQRDSMDCGPTCLQMVAGFYGRRLPVQVIRNRCHITREGVSLLGISEAAESIGLRATGVKATWEQMRDEVPLPCIAYWNQKHFVVVYGIRKRKGKVTVKVGDPAIGLLEYETEPFLNGWKQDDGEKECGIVLILEPTPDFYGQAE